MADALFIGLLALVIFGPSKLPQLARQLGRLMAELNRAKNEFTSQLQHEVDELPKQQPRELFPEESPLWSTDLERLAKLPLAEKGHRHA